MSDSEGSSSDFELVSHDALAASSAAQPSTSVGGQGSSGPAAPANVNMDRSGFVGTLRLLVQDTTRPVSYNGMTTTTTTRRSLHTQLTHSSQQQAQSPPVTDTEYDALSESSMDESDHGHGHDSAQLERAIRLFVPGQPEVEARAPALASQHLSSSSLSSDLHTSRSSLSHSTVSTTSNETDDDDQSPAHIDNQAQDHQEPPVALPLTASVATAAAVINPMDHGDPFPSTFPMLVAHLPTFTLTQVNCGGGDRQDEPAHHHQEEQFTLPGADTDADTDDDCPLIEKITGHHAFNHDLVMRSRLVHHGVASKSPASDTLGRDDDFDELVRVVPHAQAQDAAEPDDAQIDTVIDVTPHRSQLGTLVNTSAAELPDMVPVHHVSDAPAPAAAAGETHSLDASTGAADPNGLMQLLTDLELDGDSTHRLTPAAAGTGERNAAAPAPVPVPRSAMRKSATPPRSPTTSTHHLDLSPPYSRAAAAPPTDPVFASDASLHLISGGTPCPCPSCDLRVDGPGWSLFRTPGPRKYLTASMRKYADAKATHRMHARVRHASVVSTRIAHVITLAVGILIGWLVTTWWVQAGMLEAYQREVRGLHAQLVQGTAQVQATRVAVNQVHTRVAAQGTWVKAEVYEARMQVKQLASVLQAYQRAVLEGGGRGRGVVERFGELMKRADEFLGRVGGMHGYPEGVVKEKKEDGAAAEEQGQEEEAIMVEDVVVAEPDAVPTDTAVPMTPEDPNTQAPPNAPDETVTDTPQPDTNSESPVCSTASDDTEDQDNPHAIVPDSPMSMLKRSLVRAADRIDMKTRRAVLAAARALYQMSACVDEWRARAKLSLEAWLEESRAAKARRAHAAPGSAPVAPVDQEPRANDEVKPEDPTSLTEEAPDSEIPSTSPVGSADANSDDMHATMLREKLRQAQEYLRSVERQEPAEGHVMDKWERIQWANRMSAAKDTVRVVREDLERQLGSSADHV